MTLTNGMNQDGTDAIIQFPLTHYVFSLSLSCSFCHCLFLNHPSLPFSHFLVNFFFIFFFLKAYNIHVNGVLHCRVRYSQLLGLHEQVSTKVTSIHLLLNVFVKYFFLYLYLLLNSLFSPIYYQ